jgi:hypothetical protein
MTNKARRFELVVLRPLQVGFVVLVLICLLQGMWWWLGGCIISVFYLGLIGARLHPLQSSFDLAQGPTQSLAAKKESELLPPYIVNMLVDRACTSVGILLGITIGALLWGALGWSWYIAIPLTLVALVWTGAILKLAFKTI